MVQFLWLQSNIGSVSVSYKYKWKFAMIQFLWRQSNIGSLSVSDKYKFAMVQFLWPQSNIGSLSVWSHSVTWSRFASLWDPINWTAIQRFTRVQLVDMTCLPSINLNEHEPRHRQWSQIYSQLFDFSPLCVLKWSMIFYFSRGQLGQNRALPQLLQWSDYTPKSYHPTMSCHPTQLTRNKHVSKAKRLDMNLLHCKKRTSVDLKQMWGQKKWCCPNKVDSRLKKCKQKFLPHPDVGERPDSERNRKFHINRIQSLVN